MSKGKGTDYRLYVADTQPSNQRDSTDAEYEIVGFTTELSFNRSRDTIESSDKDTGSDSTFIGGRRTQEVSSTYHLERIDGDAPGQDILENAIDDTDGDPVYWLITREVSGAKAYYGEGIPSELNIEFPDEEMITTELTIQVSGSVRKFAVS